MPLVSWSRCQDIIRKNHSSPNPFRERRQSTEVEKVVRLKQMNCSARKIKQRRMSRGCYLCVTYWDFADFLKICKSFLMEPSTGLEPEPSGFTRRCSASIALIFFAQRGAVQPYEPICRHRARLLWYRTQFPVKPPLGY